MANLTPHNIIYKLYVSVMRSLLPVTPFPKARMTSPNPMPAYRLGRGTVVCGYRLLRPLGHGWEGTCYLAQEEFSGVVRRMKLYL